MPPKRTKKVVTDSSEESNGYDTENEDTSVSTPKKATARKSTATPPKTSAGLRRASKQQRIQSDSDEASSNSDNGVNESSAALDSTLDDTVPERTQESTVKRSVGRPKKTNPTPAEPIPSTSGLSSRLYNNTSEMDLSQASMIAPTPTKRGRGRPPKYKAVAATNGHSAASSRASSSQNGGSDSGSSSSDYEPADSKGKRKSKQGASSTSSRPDARRKSLSVLENSRLSQINDPTSRSLVKSLAQKCVYFLLIEDQKKYAIKRKAIVQHVFKDESYSAKIYAAVLHEASFILKKTFGLELLVLENQKDSYLIVNALKRDLCVDEYSDLPQLQHQQRGLILYLLTVIFMNGNSITEAELTKALRPLRIDLSSKRLHPIFGDPKKYITVELVKQMYLTYECINKDPPQFELQWGLRAKQEVDKRELLRFAAEVLDTEPEVWILQYRDAEES